MQAVEGRRSAKSTVCHTRYYDTGRLRLAGGQGTNLSGHVPISTFCCTNVTDGQSDIMLALVA